MKTITNEIAQKVLTKSGVRYIRDGMPCYWQIPINGKIKRARQDEIEKIYGKVTLTIESDDVFGERVIS